MGKKTRTKRRRRSGGGRRKRGVMVGMRSGFKNIADSATGKQKTSSWVSYAITIALVIAAAALILSR